MREEIISWVRICVNLLIKDFQEKDDVLILIKSFITQYELNAIRMLESGKTMKYKNRVEYTKQKIKNTLLKSEKQKIELSNSSKQLDILFWPFQKMHLDAQVEIYTDLIMDRQLNVGIFSHNQPIVNILKKKQFKGAIYTISTYSSWVDYKALPFYKDLIASVKKLPILEINSKIVFFKDVLLLSWNSWYWLYDYTLKMFDKIIEQYSPKALFVGNNITLAGNIISHKAERRGIKTFCIMHGRMNDYLEFCKFDFFYLFGVNDKKNLIKKGILSSKLVVSGSPKIDEFLKEKRHKQNKKVSSILIALSGSGHSITKQHHIQILKTLYDAAIKLTDVEFNFKLHKKDKLDYYKELRDLPNVFISEYDNPSVSSNIYDWISQTDILITGASTTALDAMIMNCPVITIDLQDQLKSVDFIKEKVSMHVTCFDELMLSINKISLRGDRYKNHLNIAKEYIQNSFTQPEQGSVDLIKKHLISIINEI